MIGFIFEKSNSGSTPWVSIFKAKVTRSTLPVLSPLPNRVPSILSAPAITPNSVAATAVPRSLWGCRLIIIFSLLSIFLQTHSIWSA